MVDWDFCAEDNCADQTVGEWYVANTPPSPCNTTEEEPCVFPFLYNNTVQHKCTGEDNGGVLWCSTETDESGEHIPGKQGNCKQDCPTCTTTDGPLCEISFKNGQTKAACSTHDGDDPWCNMIEGDWGYCADSCIGKFCFHSIILI